MSRSGGNSWWRPTRAARRSTGPGTTPPGCAWRVPRSAAPRRSPVPPDWPWRAAGDSCTRRRSARSPGPPIRTPGRSARSRSARATGRPPCPCGSQADVVTLAVTPARWGEGTGTALLTALVDEADKRGYEEVLLEVRKDNPRARRLYLRHGFAEVGIRRGYYQPSGVDAVVMRKELR